MDLNQIPLFALLKSKLNYDNQREKLVAENVANADSPGYAPRDLKPFTFEAALKGASPATGLARTNPAHMSGTKRPAGAFSPDAQPDSEVRLDGNQVVLEDEMMKMTQARLDYEAAVGFYQQSLSLITTAAREPGK